MFAIESARAPATARMLATYAALRTYTGKTSVVTLTTIGISGVFFRDDNDTTTADNAGTVIVSTNGKRWKRLFSGAIQPRWFGAIGDGVTDDTTPLNNAGAAVPLGGTLELEENKTYRITATVFAPKVAYLKGNGATIKPDATLLSAGGVGVFVGEKIAAYTGFTAVGVVADQRTFTMPAGTTASVGDMLIFNSTDVRLTASFANYNHGMCAVVVEVSGQVVTLSMPFYGAFNVTSIDRWRGQAKTTVEGVNFDLTNSLSTLNYFEALGIIGTNIRLTQSRFIGNQFSMVAAHLTGESGVVESCLFRGFRNTQGIGGSGRVGYGVAFATNSSRISSCVGVENKHFVTCGGIERVQRGNVLVENCLITEGAVSADGVGAIDCHSNLFGKLIARDNVMNVYAIAFNVRHGGAFIAEGNTIKQTGAAGRVINGFENGFEDMLLRRNTIVQFDSGSSVLQFTDSDTGMSTFKNCEFEKNTIVNGRFLVLFRANTVVENIRIHGNVARNMLSFVQIFMTSTTPMKGLYIHDNPVVEAMAGSGSNHLITLSGTVFDGRNMTFQDIFIRNNGIDASANTSGAYCLGLADGIFDGVEIKDNRLKRGTGQAWSFRNTALWRGDFSNVQIQNNTVDTYLNLGSSASGATYTKVALSGNTIKGALSISEGTTDIVFKGCSVTGNTIEYATLFSRVGTTGWATSDEILFANNTFTAATGNSVDISVGAVGNKWRFVDNAMQRRIADSSGTFYATPVGCGIPAGAPSFTWKGGCVVRGDGRLYSEAQPSTGTWSVGEEVIKITPSSAQPVRWVCTVAGTPGSWMQVNPQSTGGGGGGVAASTSDLISGSVRSHVPTVPATASGSLCFVFRSADFSVQQCDNPVVRFWNGYAFVNPSHNTATETGTGAPLQVRAAILTGGPGTAATNQANAFVWKHTFYGMLRDAEFLARGGTVSSDGMTVVIPDGLWADSDPVPGLRLQPLTRYYHQIEEVYQSGQLRITGDNGSSTHGDYRWTQVANTSSPVYNVDWSVAYGGTTPISIGAGSSKFPLAVFGTGDGSARAKLVAVEGDSIFNGGNYYQGAYGERSALKTALIAGGYSYVSPAASGSNMSDMKIYGGWRVRMSLLKYAYVVFTDHGHNDRGVAAVPNTVFATGALPVVQWHTGMLRSYAKPGAKIIRATLAPHTSSTDTWLTLANQSYQTFADNPAGGWVITYNDYVMKRGTYAGLAADAQTHDAGWDMFADLNASVADMKWPVDGATPNYWTQDGTHPSAAAYTYNVAQLQPKLAGLVGF